MLEDTFYLLLCTYNYYKPSVQNDHSHIKLNEFNFVLIKATNPELFLKRMAAQSLHEIGEAFPHEFLAYI